MPRELKPCGTPAAYARHLRDRETPCQPCREANAEAKATQGHTKVRDRARAELARLHRDEYAELARAHGTDPRRWDRARAELARQHPEEFRRLLTDEFTKQAMEDV